MFGTNNSYTVGSSGSTQNTIRHSFNSFPHQHTTMTQEACNPLTYKQHRGRQTYYKNLKWNILCYECGELGYWKKECAKWDKHLKEETEH